VSVDEFRAPGEPRPARPDNDEPPPERQEDGFEWQGRFYRWHVSDVGKDLMLIDRISGMSVGEFFEVVEDSVDRERIPVLLAVIATSIRYGNPDWSVERIYRAVLNMSLTSDIEYIDADAEELELPPAGGGATPPADNGSSESPSNGSSSSSTPTASSSSPT